MDSNELIEHAKSILVRVRQTTNFAGVKAEVCEFLRVYAGAKSSFYESASKFYGVYETKNLSSILESFISYVEAGLQSEVSPERRAQLDVVSDILEQADTLLTTKGYHPAAAAVLIGASLEEFLRNWVESTDLSLGDKKPGIENYAAMLYDNNLIKKQDKKDITSWGGTRNDAAHGNWEEVEDKKRIRLMLEGVNYFMRKYGM